MFERHHVSRHFEKASRKPYKKGRRKKNTQEQSNRRRASTVKRLPKLSLAVHAATHLILALRTTTGAGGDYPFFPPLLRDAAGRMSLEHVLADAGYDSEPNHCVAREELGIRSVMPTRNSGGPGGHNGKRAAGRYRRLMRQKGRGPEDPLYGQRWQVETVNSMLKRNLGSACRARTACGRKKDLALRVITHNLMIILNL